MLAEVLEYLAVKPDGIYLDCTAGLGGHTKAIAERLEKGFVVANDRDEDSLAMAKANTEGLHARIRFHHGGFDSLDEALLYQGVEQADGVLADLGVSRYQLTSAERGFSILADGPLDMRMDRNQALTAADFVNHYAEKAIADLLYKLGEERGARKLARAIVRARPIRSTQHLANVVERAVPRTGRLHPATKTFMALRIAVNDEMGQIDRLLAVAPGITKSGGRVVVIAFTSSEDRKVKEAFRELGRQGRGTILTKHPARPSAEEVRANPPSRSAKLRAFEVQ
ncbi:MAG: 16S rRNA (cytosine(1402)-N(4))-methyltransferase RsmH [Bryobacterales bacterium]|nr:16S rRNA (cytosine(1402)-N(4))-methyltransferase RsmH [Bryobacterales bacterium]